MLSRFIWKLIQPHLLQVLAKHDQNMKTWLNTEGFTVLEQTIQKSCKKITDDICEIVRKIDQDKIRDTEFMDLILRNLHNKIDTEIKTTVDKLEDKTSAELQRLSDKIYLLFNIMKNSSDLTNTALKSNWK